MGKPLKLASLCICTACFLSRRNERKSASDRWIVELFQASLYGERDLFLCILHPLSDFESDILEFWSLYLLTLVKSLIL